MNHPVTTKDALLEAAKVIVNRDGFQQLNIRSVSKECGISIGAVYNYFPSKADLILELIEDFWKGAVHEDICKARKGIGFPEFFGQVYHTLYDSFQKFEHDFLDHMVLKTDEEKQKGKCLEGKYINHMKHGFRIILDQDKNISPSVFHDTFTKDQFIQFVLDHMFLMLKNNESDCVFFQELLKKVLLN